MPEIPETIKRLLDTFARNIDSYKSGNMNETQIRREFIDPFFITLGWDVENKKGYADAYKDVIHEYSLKTKDVREAPDYCFHIGGMRKFFVEAKKPSVNVKEDIHPAFQVRSYAWSAKLPLSILTDFEEFAVYDCRIPPNKNDKASVARVMYFTYDQYIEKWEEISGIFSSDAVQKGSFDKYVESNKKKKGTAEVDSVFLDQMEEWRKLLAKNIALRNTSLTIRELNFAVQKTIDRIIFLRICEDRGIEDYGQLMALQNGTNIYERLKGIYDRADERYNSGLFHFSEENKRPEQPDTITPKIIIDDKTLKEIFSHLYYPESPYEFSVLPADILGQVYEQFLGKVIRLTPSHQAVVEDKPEVKKAGGVYYTPTYIVNYIVENTVGKLLENKNLKDISKIKVLDPACGSGSFLIGAFQYLLNWHLKQYTVNTSTTKKILASKQPAIYQVSNGGYLLTTAEKKRILLNNIYGVDIDSQAVEVTKLSLLLKVLEGESEETITNQMKFFRERALPDLSNNIKCGNSLIGPDFYDQMEMQFLDDEEKLRINVFDWKTEFKEIMDGGGFDVVIGNPPYLKLTQNSFDKLSLVYFENHFKSIHGGSSKNLFQLFIEKILTLKPRLFSFIVPEALLTTSSNKDLRTLMIRENKLCELIVFDHFVFKEANIGTCIFVLNKTEDNFIDSDCIVRGLESSGEIEHLKSIKLNINLDIWDTSSGNDKTNFLNKIELNATRLGDFVSMSKGMVVKNRNEYLIDKPKREYLPFLLGKSISRYDYHCKYYAKYEDLIIIGGTRDFVKQTKTPRLLIRRTGDSLCLTYSENIELIESTLYILTADNIKLKVLLGILNSKLLTFYLRQKLITNRQGYPQILMWQLEKLPIKLDKIDKSFESNIFKSVEIIIETKEKLKITKTPAEKTALQRQIDATDKQIDQLVYQLYGLTGEEIMIIEGKK